MNHVELALYLEKRVAEALDSYQESYPTPEPKTPAMLVIFCSRSIVPCSSNLSSTLHTCPSES
jgi:hypothetical protein